MTDIIQRWSPYAVDGGDDATGEMEKDPRGQFVKFEDHEQIVERLEYDMSEMARLAARIVDRQPKICAVVPSMEPDDDGEYVKFSDYCAAVSGVGKAEGQ